MKRRKQLLIHLGRGSYLDVQRRSAPARKGLGLRGNNAAYISSPPTVPGLPEARSVSNRFIPANRSSALPSGHLSGHTSCAPPSAPQEMPPAPAGTGLQEPLRRWDPVRYRLCQHLCKHLAESRK